MQALILRLMAVSKDFKIQIKGLAVGNHVYDFPVDGAFFKEFENTQILDAHLVVHVELEKGSGFMHVNCGVSGTVETECDRCLDRLEIPMDFTASLAVKFAKTDDDPQSDELLILDPTDGELDLSQFVYDYICINLPLQKVHAPGKCDPGMIEKLRQAEGGKAEESREENSPFAGLKDLLKEN